MPQKIPISRLDRTLEELEYSYLGGPTNRVYYNQRKQEVLKLGLVVEPTEVQEKLAAFQQCQEISRSYALAGLMPFVFEVGNNFQETGYPFLREQYIPGVNLNVAYLKNSAYWLDRLPEELARIYRGIQATSRIDVTATWQDKLDGMLCPSGCEDWYARVQQVGHILMSRCPVGWRIHGDLQFGNLIAREDKPGTVALIDWEVSEVMPLGYEFAMFYTFLVDPEGLVDLPLRAAYVQQTPLRAMWAGLAPLLRAELDIDPEQMRDSVLFRMGNGWLYQLAQCQNQERATELKQQLDRLLNGVYFAQVPIEG